MQGEDGVSSESCPGHTAAKRKEWDLISAFFCCCLLVLNFSAPFKKKKKAGLLRQNLHTI